MKHTYPVRHPPVPPAAQRGEITPAGQEFLGRQEPPAAPQGAAQAPLPHERDESHHGQASAAAKQQEIGQQAYDDVLGPAEDTDRGPVMDRMYHDMVSSTSGPPKPSPARETRKPRKAPVDR